MFKVLINSISPSILAVSDSDTPSTPIPDELAEGDDRSASIEISIDADLPYQHGEAAYVDEGGESIARWLSDCYGMRGKRVGERPTPEDLVAALSMARWLGWQIIEGEEILSLPRPDFPQGAIA